MVLNLLSKEDVYNIHLTSLDILQKIGVVIPSEEVLTKLDDAGAQVDFKHQRALIPQYLSEEAIRKTPHRFPVYSRDQKTRKFLGGDSVLFTTGSVATDFYDVELRKYRRLTQQDLANASKVADALENIDIFTCMGSPADVPMQIADRYMLMISLENTKKHVISEAMYKEGASDAIRMASAIVGGEEELRKKPIITIYLCITSPLHYYKPTLDAVVETCRLGLPTMVCSNPMSGATSPVTLAGTLALNMAELTSALVITRAINAEAPMLIGTWAKPLDMRESTPVQAGPEPALLRSCIAQIARYHGLPCGGGGLMSVSKTLDVQMGYEEALTALVPALSGLNLISDMGLIAVGKALSLEGLVIGDEIAGQIRRILKGIEVNEKTLAFDVMERVGATGCFMKDRHTLDHFRSELWMPKITDRTFPEIWVKNGSHDLPVRAREEVKRILKEHQVDGLSRETKEVLRTIIKQAAER